MSEKIRSAIVLGLRFLFLTRYSWLLALVLVGLPPFALLVAPTLLENLFVLDRPVQVFHVSWIAMFCAASVIGTLRITALNAIDRFEDYREACSEFHEAWGTDEPVGTHWYQRWDGWMTLFAGLAAAIAIWYVIISACVARTAADPGPGWGEFLSASHSHVEVTRLVWRQALMGAGLTLGILGTIYGATAAHQIWFAEQAVSKCSFHSRKRTTATKQSASDTPSTGGDVAGMRAYRILAGLLGPGYLREVVYHRANGPRHQIVLAPGHASVMLSTVLFLGWYAWNYWSVLKEEKMPDETSAMPALFFGLLSLLLVILVLPGISFFLDRHRIPILPTMMLIMCVCYGLFQTDHFYELNPAKLSSIPTVAARPIDEVYSNWRLPNGIDGRRTLVVVDASGGGIQASAWTAQVLTGLHELYGDTFSRSVGLISAVSGGSVGTMFYLVNRAEATPDFDPAATTTVLTNDAITRIRDASRASGLEASCWGIAYPDTMRALFPPLAGKTIDRGWSIEQIWREKMSQMETSFADLRLSHLGQLSIRNQLPVAAFNATLVETGQRLVISPVLGPPRVGETTSSGWEFLRAFPESQLRVSTAARLSATFPYVTPVSRALSNNASEKPATQLAYCHVADGAYSDNEGVVTSVDWINRLLVHYSRDDFIEKRPFDRVLLLRIQAFPRQKVRKVAVDGNLRGWRAALLGPFDAMMQVRSASQTERGDLEINLLTRVTMAEVKAARERTQREFQSALLQVEQLESVHEELFCLAGALGDMPSEAEREFLDVQKNLQVAKGTLQQAQERGHQATELLVESVVFDFQPVDQVSIPMSWKLTVKQKRQLDNSWQQLVDGRLQFQPLAVLDKYFQRARPNRPRPAEPRMSFNRKP